VESSTCDSYLKPPFYYTPPQCICQNSVLLK
jgi:hypothetical protein